MANYVMSDVHGNKEKFFKLLEQIKLRKRDTLYILGDLIDIGEDSIELLKYVMEQKNIVLLKGDHERDMCAAICQESAGVSPAVLDLFNAWFSNGGKVTYQKLLNEPSTSATQIVRYVRELRDHALVSVRGKAYLLAHAGIAIRSELSFVDNLEVNTAYGLIYDIREEYLSAEWPLPCYIITGHTPVARLPEYIKEMPEEAQKRCFDHKIAFHGKKIFVDCGCGNGGALGCIRLEDQAEFYA